MKLFRTAAIAAMMMISTLAQAKEPPTFTTLEGQPATIESFAGDGKWLVVMIWAHDCGICHIEAPDYARFHNEHKDKDVRVLGISMDGAEHKAKAEAFIARHDLPFPNLIGEPALVALNYMNLTMEQFRGTPTFLVYSPDGKLTAAQPGALPTSSVEAFIARNSS